MFQWRCFVIIFERNKKEHDIFAVFAFARKKKKKHILIDELCTRPLNVWDTTVVDDYDIKHKCIIKGLVSVMKTSISNCCLYKSTIVYKMILITLLYESNLKKIKPHDSTNKLEKHNNGLFL